MNPELDALARQAIALIDGDLPLVSNLSNVAAVLYRLPDVNWAGFYLVGGDTLYLGPFQGEPACTKIPLGKGVCGTCLQKKEPIIVPNVLEFPGHIACSSASRSEIVVPIFKKGEMIALIDIDSPIFDRFHEDELYALTEIAKELEKSF